MRSAVMLVSESFKPFEIYMTVGAIYLALSLLSSWLVSLLEQRLRPLEKAFTGREQPIFEPQVSL
jgi:ABC-type amino acid transport system permease subunit